MLKDDFHKIRDACCSAAFFIGPDRVRRSTSFKAIVRAFCEIEFPDKLELMNLWRRHPHPLASKKIETFKGSFLLLLLAFLSNGGFYSCNGGSLFPYVFVSPIVI